MGNKYDEIAAKGGQEYSIFVRQFGGEDKSWLPCGSVAVPRSAQVSDAIFANEDALKSSITRTFPKLKGFEAEFEYGYNLKVRVFFQNFVVAKLTVVRMCVCVNGKPTADDTVFNLPLFAALFKLDLSR